MGQGREEKAARSSWSSLRVPRAKSAGELGASVGSTHSVGHHLSGGKGVEYLHSSHQSLVRAAPGEGSVILSLPACLLHRKRSSCCAGSPQADGPWASVQ